MGYIFRLGSHLGNKHSLTRFYKTWIFQDTSCRRSNVCVVEKKKENLNAINISMLRKHLDGNLTQSMPKTVHCRQFARRLASETD